MHRLSTFRLVLILMLILTNFLIHGNAAAQCPEDPCPQQTQTGEIINNPEMVLQWEEGFPPSIIERNKAVTIKLKSGKIPFTWTFTGLEETDVVIKSSEMSIEISPTCITDENIIVTVTDGKNTLDKSINVIPLPIQFDFSRTGSGEVGGNSSKKVYVEGGCGGPYTWTTQETGFYFNSGLTDKNITTESTQARLYTNNSACGVATIDVVDGFGAEATGYVRSSNGRWANKTNGCIIPGEPDGPSYPSSSRYRTEGKYYQFQDTEKAYLEWGKCPGDCGQSCKTDKGCHPVYGCSDCIFPFPDYLCKNSGYAGNPCPPVCRRWCSCTSELWYQEWVCN